MVNFIEMGHGLLLRSEKNRSGHQPVILETPDDADKTAAESVIVCRNCGNRITKPSEQLAVQGAQRHTFTNPEGVLFEIGCFKQAEGCRYSGSPTAEWSWFRGFRWRFAFCGQCARQLGWLFIAETDSIFHGLILNRLLFPS